MGYAWDPREQLWEYGQDVVQEAFEESELDLLRLADLLRHAWLGPREVIPLAKAWQGKDVSGTSRTTPSRVVCL
jgi:hypothetical protein